MNVRESLSRLMDGELHAEETAALRERIASEPEVARAWAAMNRLPLALSRLPDVAPPAFRSPAPVRRNWAGRVTILALAAALLLAVLAPRPRTQMVVGSGVSMIEGNVDVFIGDVEIAVDGKSLITVEPLRGSGRDAESEATMDRTHLLAAFVGAAVSLTVDQGTATLKEPGKEPVTLTSGQTKSVGHAAPPPRPQTSVAADTRIADLEQEIAGLKLQHAFEQGQLNGMNGAPQEFPSDLPAAYSPAEFERTVREGLRNHPNANLLSMNCEEYPCIAILSTTETGEDWGKNLSDLGQSIKDGAYGNDAAIHEDAELLHGPNGDVRVMAFSTAPKGGEDENTSTRRAYRVKSLMEAIGDSDE